MWDCKPQLFSFGDSWVRIQSAQFCELSAERIALNRHQKPELWTGILERLDTMIDRTFPRVELDLAFLQMSEGTQGARTLTLHLPFLGNFSHHLALSETSV